MQKLLHTRIDGRTHITQRFQQPSNCLKFVLGIVLRLNMILFGFIFVHLEGFEVVDEYVGHPQTVDQLKVDCNENRRQVRSTLFLFKFI